MNKFRFSPSIHGSSVLLMWLSGHHPHQAVIAAKLSSLSTSKIPLSYSDPNLPFCYVAANATELMGLQKPANFLATQTWPSARMSSHMLLEHFDPEWAFCEFGCGPGLPSITAAHLGSQNVIATDVDEVALELVERAAKEQFRNGAIKTKKFDLEADPCTIPAADLYLLSDVFQSNAVAVGAARVVHRIIEASNSMVWVTSQTDRAQREEFRLELMKLLQDQTLTWEPRTSKPTRLWLVDVDELEVKYC